MHARSPRARPQSLTTPSAPRAGDKKNLASSESSNINNKPAHGSDVPTMAERDPVDLGRQLVSAPSPSSAKTNLTDDVLRPSQYYL